MPPVFGPLSPSQMMKSKTQLVTITNAAAPPMNNGFFQKGFSFQSFARLWSVKFFNQAAVKPTESGEMGSQVSSKRAS